LDRPYTMLGFNVCAAETEEEALYLRSSSIQSFLNLRRGTPGQLPPPVKDLEISGPEQSMIDQVRRCSAVGDRDIVKDQLQDFVTKHQVDELMIVCSVYDQSLRLRSYEITADIGRELEAMTDWT